MGNDELPEVLTSVHLLQTAHNVGHKHAHDLLGPVFGHGADETMSGPMGDLLPDLV